MIKITKTIWNKCVYYFLIHYYYIQAQPYCYQHHPVCTHAPLSISVLLGLCVSPLSILCWLWHRQKCLHQHLLHEQCIWVMASPLINKTWVKGPFTWLITLPLASPDALSQLSECPLPPPRGSGIRAGCEYPREQRHHPPAITVHSQVYTGCTDTSGWF